MTRAKIFERRYHATWTARRGYQSPLARLGYWIHHQPGKISSAPLDLLANALRDVAERLPTVAAREPTRRHRKHFGWLLGWHDRITAAIGRFS